MLLSLISLAFAQDFCWRNTKLSSIGKKPSECPSGEKVGTKCFEPCKKGYKSDGKMCYEDCPKGYHEDKKECKNDSGKTHQRKSYDRGDGTNLQCAPDTIEKKGSCFAQCSNQTFAIIGPLCLQKCGGDFPVGCGAGCASSSQACRQNLAAQVMDIKDFLVKIALEVSNGNPVNIHPGMNPVQIAQAVFQIAQQLQGFIKTLLKDEAGIIAKQMVSNFIQGTPIDWSQLDVLGLGTTFKDFKKPKC